MPVGTVHHFGTNQFTTFGQTHFHGEKFSRGERGLGSDLSIASALGASTLVRISGRRGSGRVPKRDLQARLSRGSWRNLFHS